jgi:hypothetical protein
MFLPSLLGLQMDIFVEASGAGHRSFRRMSYVIAEISQCLPVGKCARNFATGANFIG